MKHATNFGTYILQGHKFFNQKSYNICQHCIYWRNYLKKKQLLNYCFRRIKLLFKKEKNPNCQINISEENVFLWCVCFLGCGETWKIINLILVKMNNITNETPFVWKQRTGFFKVLIEVRMEQVDNSHIQ